VLIRPLKFVINYISALSTSLDAIGSRKLSQGQQTWFVTILMGLITSGCFNWASFERKSLGSFKESRLRWVFHHAKIAWGSLLQASTRVVLSHYNLKNGVLVLDDSDKARSRNTSKIAGVHKVKDKKTGGWFNGQEFIFLILVTDTLTLPVGFRFYNPDPSIKAWRKTRKGQIKAGIPVKERAKKPKLNPAYPSKQTIALQLLEEFSKNHPNITVQSVLADALYGNAKFMDQAANVTSCSQVISQLRKNQLVLSRGKKISLTRYFERNEGVKSTLKVGGSQDKNVTMQAARIVVKAHGKKRFVIALKYEGEKDYRFIVATDLSWRHQDVVRTYTLRWLIEVFIQDWKAHGGWNALSKQQGEKGAMQGITLSLLCDHLLLLHPEQSARLKNKQPAMPVGCLVEHVNAQALIDGVSSIVHAKEPKKEFDKFKNVMQESLPDRNSTKHMAGLDLGRMEQTPSLKYQAAA